MQLLSIDDSSFYHRVVVWLRISSYCPPTKGEDGARHAPLAAAADQAFPPSPVREEPRFIIVVVVVVVVVHLLPWPPATQEGDRGGLRG